MFTLRRYIINHFALHSLVQFAGLTTLWYHGAGHYIQKSKRLNLISHINSPESLYVKYPVRHYNISSLTSILFCCVPMFVIYLHL
jgi:hypothetical protein